MATKKTTKKASKKLTEIYTAPGEVMYRDELANTVAKKSKLDLKFVNSLLARVDKGEELNTEGVDDAKLIPKVKKAIEVIEQMINVHDEVSAATEAEEDEQVKRGEVLALASVKGYAIAEKVYVDSSVNNLQLSLGEKFVVGKTSVSIAEGETISEADMAEAIGTLSEITERQDQVKGVINLNLGSLIILARESFGDEKADEIIQQVVSTRGKAKHTVVESERVVRFIRRVFPNGDEPEGLTYTHWQELKNGFQDRDGKLKAKSPTIKKVIREATEGDVVGRVEIDGEEVVQRKPISTASLRDRIKETTGESDGVGSAEAKAPAKKKAATKSEGEEPVKSSAHRYLYLQLEDINNVVYSDKIIPSLMNDDWALLDTQRLTSLDTKGKPYVAFRNLDEWNERDSQSTESDDDDMPE